jgi:hypothetical protein
MAPANFVTRGFPDQERRSGHYLQGGGDLNIVLNLGLVFAAFEAGPEHLNI